MCHLCHCFMILNILVSCVPNFEGKFGKTQHWLLAKILQALQTCRSLLTLAFNELLYLLNSSNSWGSFIFICREASMAIHQGNKYLIRCSGILFHRSILFSVKRLIYTYKCAVFSRLSLNLTSFLSIQPPLNEVKVISEFITAAKRLKTDDAQNEQLWMFSSLYVGHTYFSSNLRLEKRLIQKELLIDRPDFSPVSLTL